jgi:hypothetical protein
LRIQVSVQPLAAGTACLIEKNFDLAGRAPSDDEKANIE